MRALRGRRAAFRPTPSSVAAPRPSRRQAVALLAVLVLVTSAVAAVSYLVRPERARAFALFHGSVFLADSVAPVAVDLASGRPTVRLVQAAQQVGARTNASLSVVPLRDGTLLLNRRTGEFNMVASTGFVVKTDGGVPIATHSATRAAGIASGQDAYVEQTGPTGTSVYLVGESTVQTATVTGQKVKPRAQRSMTEPTSTQPSASAVADGDLWLLVGGGTTRTVRRLHVPADSSPGAVLASSDHGTVPAVSAIEASGVRGEAPDNGPAAVGVATARSIRIVAGRSVRTVHFAPWSGTDQVLAASNAGDRLTYLLHGTSGWSEVSVADDGSDVRGPVALGAIAANAELAPPAMSDGAIYTLDRRTGRTFGIDPAGRVTALPSYPLARVKGKIIEPAGFDDGYLIARGPRVIVNSPSHLDALVLFTDGSHRPLVIEKSSAVSVNAAGSADTLTRSRRVSGKSHTTTKAPPKQKEPAPVDNQVDCHDTRQKPHIPSIVGALPGSRSVQLSWTYPTPDPQDCEPSTYVVGVRLVGDNAPSPPSSVRVQGQTSVNLAGLFPSTQYDVTVTAYINGLGTASAARLITTGPAGPAAPSGVTASADSAGNWTITWRSCGTIAQGCVPSTSWKVIPQFCDGRGLSGAPAPITVPADPTTAVQAPAQLRGGDALLGRGVRFQVEGIGRDSAIGTPSAYTACTYSWSRPVGSGITVAASTPPATGAQQTTSTTATVRFADGAIHDLGGVDGTLTYRLLDSSGRTVTTVGPTTSTSVHLAGIVPGAAYSVQVVATPPRHPEAAVTLPPVTVVPAAAIWPTPDVQAHFTDTGLLDGSLSVSFSLPGVDDLHGETFDLVGGGASQLVCGSTAMPLSGSDVTPGQTLTFLVQRTQYSGPCHVDLVLEQDGSSATKPPLFGSGNSPQGSSNGLSIDPPTVTTNAHDFSAQWNNSYSNPSIAVSYSGHDFLQLATNWQITASNGTSANCGTSNNGPTTTISADTSCVEAGGTWTVSIAYTYLGHDENFQVSVQGSAPQPITSDQIDFSAAWNTDATDPSIQVTYTGTATRSQLNELNWTETVTANSGATQCQLTPQHTNPGDGDFAVSVSDALCPPGTSTYVITITYKDPTYGGTGSYAPEIAGEPPQ